jgi:hypothetical protein
LGARDPDDGIRRLPDPRAARSRSAAQEIVRQPPMSPLFLKNSERRFPNTSSPCSNLALKRIGQVKCLMLLQGPPRSGTVKTPMPVHRTSGHSKDESMATVQFRGAGRRGYRGRPHRPNSKLRAGTRGHSCWDGSSSCADRLCGTRHRRQPICPLQPCGPDRPKPAQFVPLYQSDQINHRWFPKIVN